MGKPTICIGKNKGTDQLRSNCEADQSAFVFTKWIVQSLFYLYPKFQVFSTCTGQFVSDLVGNRIVGFPTRRLIYQHDYSGMERDE